MTKSKENKNWHYFTEKQETLIKSKIGQHLLLLFIPFIYPKVTDGTEAPVEKIVNALHLKFLSPFIGSGFIVLALAFTERLLAKKNINLFFVLNLDSVTVIYHLTFIVGVLAYSLALSRFLARFSFTKLLKQKELQIFPLSYWCARYAGILVYSGFLVMIINLGLWLSLSLWGFIILLTFFLGILYIGITEIFKSFNQLREPLTNKEQRFLNLLEYTLFLMLIALLIVAYWWIYPKINL